MLHLKEFFTQTPSVAYVTNIRCAGEVDTHGGGYVGNLMPPSCAPRHALSLKLGGQCEIEGADRAKPKFIDFPTTTTALVADTTFSTLHFQSRDFEKLLFELFREVALILRD